MTEEIEDTHYNICKEHDMNYLHYVIHTDNYINMPSSDDMKQIVTKDYLLNFKNKLDLVINTIAQSPTISMYSLLDYVALSHVDHGVEALYKLGYHANLDGPPISYYDHGDYGYSMEFYHPGGRSISYYDDDKNNDFTICWFKLKERQEK